LPRESWQAAATAFIALRGQGVSKHVQDGIVSEVLAILHEPTFGVLFGPDSRAEVPIAAEIPDPRGSRPTLRLTGQIDRFVRLPHEVMILDYKTNRPPPLDPAQVAPIYVSQLAAYRLAIKQIFPELPVRGAILWTDGCRLMPIPSEMLDEREDRLWEQGSARLDAV
jgi:ATP-dependent helicase/nuclease subunit A